MVLIKYTKIYKSAGLKLPKGKIFGIFYFQFELKVIYI